MVYFELVFMLLLILVAAEIFVNALEHLGHKLGISEGVTGSLFAAVGTALPETLVPLLAIFSGTDDQALNADIGVGAILGAPLMLSTLAMFLLLLATARRRGLRGAFAPEPTGLRRDLDFFLFCFFLAALALFVPPDARLLRTLIGLGLVMVYFFYILLTLRASEQLVAEGHGTEADRPMLLTRIGLPDHMAVTAAQLALGLALLILGAHGFIHGIEQVSSLLGIPALVLSLLIIPIATELPEKVNSFLWIRRGRDTLAFGNLTGAMVFQGSLLPAIGILLTPWAPVPEVVAVVLVTLIAALWLRLLARRGLKVWHVAVNGVLYVGYLTFALTLTARAGGGD